MTINEPFYHSVSNLKVTQKTTVNISKCEDGLYLNFICYNNKYTRHNEFTQNNQPLWQQEVLEVFISQGDAIPSKYLEFQINPNNAIFLANVDNPCLTGKNNQLTYLNPTDFDLNSSVIIDTENNLWKGKFTLPYSLIGSSPYRYRINIFRIIAEQEPQTVNWKGTPETCTYACWKPTSGLIKPSFHQPKSFELIQL